MSTTEDLEDDRGASASASTSPESTANYEDRLSDLQRQLRDCLNNVPSAGSFACFGVEPKAVNPGIYVKDVGVVGLPLAEREARIRIGHSHQSPFGRGSETIIDTSVRKTWELNTDQFELRNPAWPPFLQELVAVVAKKLGTDTDVQAELYKMLLYESGGYFKPHSEYSRDRFSRNVQVPADESLQFRESPRNVRNIGYMSSKPALLVLRRPLIRDSHPNTREEILEQVIQARRRSSQQHRRRCSTKATSPGQLCLSESFYMCD